MWFSEYLFLERNWAKDEITIESGLNHFKDYPNPFWLGLFVEGTRFTESKLRDAQEFASSKGWPIPQNVLNPRTKGFVAAVTHMRSFVPAIYDRINYWKYTKWKTHLVIRTCIISAGQ
jgi:lysophosphatidic acid acyltransferase/lysophosphatidylinositol acyltransferase